ncbi:hypothetical protein DFH09DRAFT_1319189 [Mycena vulgaris]|nr:hypothetical protein DFH09DRAFT_1319189 [Mycena vulgaris]
MFLMLNLALPRATYWMPFHQAVGKLYVNSVFATLNVRNTFVEPEEPQATNLSFLMPAGGGGRRRQGRGQGPGLRRVYPPGSLRISPRPPKSRPGPSACRTGGDTRAFAVIAPVRQAEPGRAMATRTRLARRTGKETATRWVSFMSFSAAAAIARNSPPPPVRLPSSMRIDACAPQRWRASPRPSPVRRLPLRVPHPASPPCPMPRVRTARGSAHTARGVETLADAGAVLRVVSSRGAQIMRHSAPQNGETIAVKPQNAETVVVLPEYRSGMCTF